MVPSVTGVGVHCSSTLQYRGTDVVGAFVGQMALSVTAVLARAHTLAHSLRRNIIVHRVVRRHDEADER